MNAHNEDGFFKSHHSKVLASISNNQLHEFSALTTDDARFCFIYKLPKQHELNIQLSPCGKNTDIARKLKDDGNKAFQSGDYHSALQLYTKSVLRTPWEEGVSRDLAVVIANRSAALYHLEQHVAALSDVNTVLTLDYPPELRYKVLDRKARCLLARKQLKDALAAFRGTLQALDSAKLPMERKQKWQMDVQIMLSMLGRNKEIENAPLQDISGTNIPLPSVTGNRNPHYRSASSAVTVEHNTTMGRFAQAAQDVIAGDTLVVEPAYCSVLLAEHSNTHCFHCFNRLVAPVPCPQCSTVAFCCTACQQQALASHHGVECGMLATLWSSGASVTCLMALRILSQHGLKHFLNVRQQLDQVCKAYSGSDYRSVYGLVCHEHNRTPDDFFHRSDMAVFLLRCLQAGGFFGEKTSTIGSEPTADEAFVGGLLLRHLQLLQFNAHEVSELQLETNGHLDSARSVFLGGGLYPTLALFNHSCDPGVARYFHGTSVVVRAVKNIDKGDMIAENYGPIFTQTAMPERLAVLKSQYWFDCTCVPCQQDWPRFNDMNTDILRFKCDNDSVGTEKCKNIIQVSTDTMEFMVQCSVCNGHTNILRGLKALQDTDTMFRTAKHLMDSNDVSKALAKFVEILTLLDETLAPPFRDYHLCQQAIRRCLLSMGNKCVKR